MFILDTCLIRRGYYFAIICYVDNTNIYKAKRCHFTNRPNCISFASRVASWLGVIMNIIKRVYLSDIDNKRTHTHRQTDGQIDKQVH